jgi:two-component system, chemotaxis family, protein-glutamate methylesterase/glutaminase
VQSIQEKDLLRPYKAIVIGGSAGSFQVMNKMLSQLPADYPLPIIACMHRLKHIRNGFVEALSIKSKLPVIEPDDKETLRKSKVYIAPANYHMHIELGNTVALSTEEMINNSRPAIDITLATAAYNYKEKLIGILLSGANKDGALGMKQIADKGGLTIVQDPKECTITTMPDAALAITRIDYVMRSDEITRFLLRIAELNKGNVV